MVVSECLGVIIIYLIRIILGEIINTVKSKESSEKPVKNLSGKSIYTKLEYVNSNRVKTNNNVATNKSSRSLLGFDTVK